MAQVLKLLQFAKQVRLADNESSCANKRRRQWIYEDASLSLQERAAGSDTPRHFVWQRREPILRSDMGRRNRLHAHSPSEFVRWEDGPLLCAATCVFQTRCWHWLMRQRRNWVLPI